VYYEVSIDGTILEVSPSIKIISKGQYKREDLIGKSITELYSDQNIRESLISLIIKDNEVIDFEVLLKNRDNSTIPCSISSKIQFSGNGITGKIIGTIRDISRRKKVEELLKRRVKELAVNQEATISSMAILAEFRDPETGAHIQRTKFYVKLLLEKLGDKTSYPPEIIELIWHSAPLHDIGKVGIRDNILLKPGKLTDEEFELMKKHTLLGGDVIRRAEKILGEGSFLNFAREITEFHHEKWDGSGYPKGLKGNEIPLCARLMALADVYDALVNKRVYKQPIPHEEAARIVHDGSGSHFDPALVEIFEANNLEFDRIANQYKDG
jgi:PAS domain S-box-containing protein